MTLIPNGSPAASYSPRQLAELIERFRRMAANWHDRRAALQGTTPAKAHLLQILASCGPGTMNNLNCLLEVTPRKVTKLVDRLEHDGLVTRNPHPQNRRATLISATPPGIALSEQTGRDVTAMEAVLHRLDPTQQAELRRVLEKLI